MFDWRLLGPKIPHLVWQSRVLRAVDLYDAEQGIHWEPMPAQGGFWPQFDRRRLGPDERCLLLIHGTGQRTREGFLGFTPEQFQRLSLRYGGRILAFEHRAIGHDLSRNVRELREALETAGVRLTVDVLGLSRGGLIARAFVEGWAQGAREPRLLEVRRLIFIGTPNAGTPSARRDPWGLGATLMRHWRVDARRVALVNQRERSLDLAPHASVHAPYRPEPRPWLRWPLLYGTQDQLPDSEALSRLNGFAGPSSGGLQAPPPEYYGIAAHFSFDHGAPDPVLARLGGRAVRRSDVVQWALPVPNDLVVPTSSVYNPPQGEHGCGLFPLPEDRLLVLGPGSNATHVGLLRLAGVRARILAWLGA